MQNAPNYRKRRAEKSTEKSLKECSTPQPLSMMVDATILVVLEKDTDRLAMVDTADGLGKYRRNIQNLELGA